MKKTRCSITLCVYIDAGNATNILPCWPDRSPHKVISFSKDLAFPGRIILSPEQSPAAGSDPVIGAPNTAPCGKSKRTLQ